MNTSYGVTPQPQSRAPKNVQVAIWIAAVGAGITAILSMFWSYEMMSFLAHLQQVLHNFQSNPFGG